MRCLASMMEGNKLGEKYLISVLKRLLSLPQISICRLDKKLYKDFKICVASVSFIGVCSKIHQLQLQSVRFTTFGPHIILNIPYHLLSIFPTNRDKSNASSA
jgi:hypothetical protein